MSRYRYIFSFLVMLSLFTTVTHQIAAESLERNVSLMGTTLQMTLYDTDKNRALLQSEKWIQIVEQAEQELSNWRESSELSQFNRHPIGKSFEMSTSLCNLFPVLQFWTTKTNGMFDPGVGQLIKIWGFYNRPHLPNSLEIENALQKTGIMQIEVNEQKCGAIRKSDVLLDSGAFGKGEALLRILLNAHDVDSPPFLMNFGGQVLVYGKPPQKKDWVLQLADPVNRQNGSGIRVRLEKGSLSTSGGSERDRIVNGKKIGHILDPHTGGPVPSFGSVTVWHESPLIADILSTALYVFGPKKGLDWANDNDVAACFLVINGEKIEPLYSSAFGKHTIESGD